MTAHATRLVIVQSDRDTPTLVLTGDLDASTAPDLQTALEGIDTSSTIALDLAGVSFVDSSGLRVLVQAHTRQEDGGGSLTLRSPSEQTMRLLEISGLMGHLSVDAAGDAGPVLD